MGRRGGPGAIDQRPAEDGQRGSATGHRRPGPPRPSSWTVPAGLLYDTALRAGPLELSTLRARYRGDCATLPVHRWLAVADAVDREALSRFSRALPRAADVLDLGCGPGRHTAELHLRGVRALGIDASAVAVALAQRRGAPALRADALGPLPGGSHGWDGLLLLDGNVGIGGDPLPLLCRVRELLRPTGRVLVELDPRDATDAGPARLGLGRATSSPFPWARLGGSCVSDVARCADLSVQDRWTRAGRAFAVLVLRAGGEAPQTARSWYPSTTAPRPTGRRAP